jgi:Undecaprenyl-phosphate galactose phosphotransferase WbaP
MLGRSASAAGVELDGGHVGGPVVEVRDAPSSRVQNRNLHRVRDPKIVRSARRANSRLKRIFDVAATLCGGVFLLPFIATIAAIIKLSDGGPAFYGHVRVGRSGRLFICWKFRTMVVDADRALADYLEVNPEAAREWRENQKLLRDPRITRIGRFLRDTSLDELPQLYNVLRADMSLVGPRPVTKQELNERYAKDRRYYLLVRPGVTGLWQVSGRNRLSYSRRVQLDEEYLREWSFAHDLQILLRTVDVVFRRDGAC